MESSQKTTHDGRIEQLTIEREQLQKTLATNNEQHLMFVNDSRVNT
jgi:hypothetical protein